MAGFPLPAFTSHVPFPYKEEKKNKEAVAKEGVLWFPVDFMVRHLGPVPAICILLILPSLK